VYVGHTVEDSRVECEQYWFDDYSAHLYGNISVMLVKVTSYANFVIRLFQLLKDGLADSSRLVYQYQYLAWPERGVPNNPLTLIEFHSKVRSKVYNMPSSDDSPLLVHCGSGAGGTAVFIAVDYSLLKTEKEKENCVNVYR
jgi:protein tyrosine phosphatase